MYLLDQKLLWCLCLVCLNINYLNSMFNWLHDYYKTFLIMTNILTSSLWCCFQTTAAYFKQDYVCEGFFFSLVRLWKLYCWVMCIWEFSFFFPSNITELQSSGWKYFLSKLFWYQCLLKWLIQKELEVKLALFLCMWTLFFLPECL